MVAAADAQNYAQKLGITTDMVVQELGWDEDTDDGIRAAVEETIGGEMLDEDSDEVIDVVLLWWRDEDGDLVDALMDAIGPSPTKASCGFSLPRPVSTDMSSPARSPNRRRLPA